MPNLLTQQACSDWASACTLLEDSLGRYIPYRAKQKYSAHELEFYDSLSFRFIKSLEAAFYFFRSLETELSNEPKDFLRDRLLLIEKTGIIQSTDDWLTARDLRNKIAHGYDPEALEKIFPFILQLSSMVIASCGKARLFLDRQPS